MRFAEPHGCTERLVNMHGHEDPSDYAVDRIQNPFPSNGAQRDGRNPRQENQETNDAAATEPVFQCNGENVGADHHNDLGADGKDEGISNRDSKTRALQDAAEVFQANEMHFSIADAGVAKGIKDSQEKGTADEQHYIESRRQKHRRTQRWALRGADRFYFVAGYCHDKDLGSTRFSVMRSKNFSSLDGTTKSHVSSTCRSRADASREKISLPSSFPPISLPETIHSEPRYSRFSTLKRNGTESPALAEPGRKCSGRKPTITSPSSTRFIGGEPRKVATKVSAGLS